MAGKKSKRTGRKNFNILYALCCLFLVLVFAAGAFLFIRKGNTGVTLPFTQNKKTITIWYTDEALTDYIDSAALSFYEETGIRINPVLKSGLDYISEINEASKSDESIPDLYVIGSDSIGETAMAGLSIPVPNRSAQINATNYPDVALKAVTLNGDIYGYPFYYETAFLLYNESYIAEIADTALREEIIDANNQTIESPDDGEMKNISENAVGENAPPEGYSEEEWNNMVALKATEIMPHSISDILNIASNYSAPENVTGFFLWDVSDIFYNYFFSGAYINVGGEYGDDNMLVDVANDDVIACMKIYQGLNQYFSIDSKESSYDNVISEFLDGKIIFTIATSDVLKRIENAKNEGTFEYNYGIAKLPDIDEEHKAGGLSTTSCIVVNGYGINQSEADAFAAYLAIKQIDDLYGKSGKMSAANTTDDYIIDASDIVREVYKDSVGLPKTLEMSNFWVQLELIYTRIWDGADVEESLKELEDFIKKQTV